LKLYLATIIALAINDGDVIVRIDALTVLEGSQGFRRLSKDGHIRHIATRMKPSQIPVLVNSTIIRKYISIASPRALAFPTVLNIHCEMIQTVPAREVRRFLPHTTNLSETEMQSEDRVLDGHQGNKSGLVYQNAMI
jgi:hypothetical protein